MALLPFSAFTGAFFFCEIAQILKLLKENELFSRHFIQFVGEVISQASHGAQ